MEHFTIYTNNDVYAFIKQKNLMHSDVHAICGALQEKLDLSLSEAAEYKFCEKMRKFCKKLQDKWQTACRIEAKFIAQNQQWLSTRFEIPLKIRSNSNKPVFHGPTPSTSTNFEVLSERQKRRKTETLRKSPKEHIMFAAKKLFKSTDAQFILDFMQDHPEHISKIRKFCEDLDRPCRTTVIPKETALGVYVSAKLTKCQYMLVKKVADDAGCQAYPSYFQLQSAKRECYPDRESIEVTEVGAQVKLQSLMNTTAIRLLQAVKFVPQESATLTLVTKWGCDGAANQSTYKQNFNDTHAHDSNIFIASCVPIKLYNTNTKEVIWQNNKPSSTRFCRPIMFEYSKENDAIIQKFTNIIQKQVEELLPTTCGLATITHQLLLTMIDGKICNALTDNQSSMRCYICGASPKEMNNLTLLHKKSVRTEFYAFGISSLHAWIRCFECLLHIAYNLPFMSWSARTLEEKKQKEERKKHIQSSFRTRLGLHVDIVKQGTGTTNDGNTARKFFAHPEISAEITGIDHEIIFRFAVILQAIASGRPINIENFRAYTVQTTQRFLALYSWYYMPASVHKLLFHGADIIQSAIVPIGQLSEDALEANHKLFRKYRENNSRKHSRTANNTDVLNSLLIASDPLISMLSNSYWEVNTPEILGDVRALLQIDDMTDD